MLIPFSCGSLLLIPLYSSRCRFPKELDRWQPIVIVMCKLFIVLLCKVLMMREIKIPIAEDAYKALLMEKKEKESLSDVILRLSKKKSGRRRSCWRSDSLKGGLGGSEKGIEKGKQFDIQETR